jgi:quercetin dioxygenase-like cupin family protein
MEWHNGTGKRILSIAGLLSAMAATLPTPAPAVAQERYIVKPIAEMKIKVLPRGPLYWRIETFPSLEQAKAAAGTFRWNPDAVSYDGSPSLAAEVAGKVWLFTLAAPGGMTPGGSKVAEIGPVPPVVAPEYLLRVNHGSGPPASRTPMHSHPGSEAFYVVAGRLGQQTSDGVHYVDAGQTMNGHAPDMPMEVFNAGTTDLTALIMFVVDATRPFSVPAKLP